jgi:hypothetical protein
VLGSLVIATAACAWSALPIAASVAKMLAQVPERTLFTSVMIIGVAHQ